MTDITTIRLAPGLKNSLGGIDALRGVLSIVVCIAHGYHTFVAPFRPEDQQQTALILGILARLAVIQFFCLSGYVIAMSISRNVHLNGSFSGPDYVLARIFRIAPPLLAVVGIVALCTSLAKYFGVHALPSGVTTVRNALDVNVNAQLLAIFTLALRGDLTGWLNGPLWTLGFEIQLYAIAGTIAYGLFASKSRAVLRVAISIASLLFLQRFIPHSEHDPITANTLWLLSFAFGALSYYFLNYSSPYVILCFSLLGASVFFGLGLQSSAQEYVSGLDTRKTVLLSQAGYAVLSTAIIVLLSRASATSFLRSLGGFSYTLYILHFPVLIVSFFVVENTFPITSSEGAMLWGTCAVSLSIAIARLLALGVERPSDQRAWTVHRIQTFLGRNSNRL